MDDPNTDFADTSVQAQQPQPDYQAPQISPQDSQPTSAAGLSLTPEDADTQSKLSITPTDTPPALSRDVLADKAAKYDYALGDKSPGAGPLFDSLNNGGDDLERQRAAIGEQIQGRAVKNNLIQNILTGKGGDLNQSDISTVMQLRDSEAVDPQTVMEKLYARRLTNEMLTTGLTTTDKSTWNDAVQENPERSYGIADAFEKITAQNEVDVKILDELMAKWKDTSWYDAAHQFGENQIPGLLWWDTHNAIPGLGTSAFLPGSNLQEQRTFLKTLPPEQYEQALRAALGPLEHKNLSTAIAWMSAMHEFSSSDQNLYNFRGISDLTFVGGAGLNVATKTAQLGMALAGVARARSLVRNLSAAKVLDAGGNVPAAVHAQVIADLSTRAAKTGQSVSDLTQNAMSIFNINKVMTGAKDFLSAVQVVRLENQLTKTATDLIDTQLQGTLYVDRITRNSDALGNLVESTTNDFKKLFNRANDSIISVSHINSEDTFNNDAIKVELGKRPGQIAEAAATTPAKQARIDTLTKQVSDLQAAHDAIPDNAPEKAPAASKLASTQAKLVKAQGTATTQVKLAVSLGKPDATLFSSYKAANRYATEDLGLRKYTVENRGGRFFIQTYHYADETDPTVRAALLNDTDAKTSRGFFKNIFFNYLRSPDEKLGTTLVKELKAVYGESMLMGSLKRALKPVEGLSGTEKENLSRFASRLQETPNPNTGGRGVFADNVSEFNKFYYDQFKELPTFKQTQAYFSYRQVNDANYMNYNLGLGTQKFRKGLMNFELPYDMKAPSPNPMTSVSTGAVKNLSNKIEGKILDRIPWETKGKEPTAGILIWDRDPTKIKRIPFSAAPNNLDTMIKQQGLTIINPSEVGERALRSTPALKDIIPEGNISMILTKEHNASTLDLKQVPYLPGGHVQYPNGWMLSQPNIVISGQTKNKKGIPNKPDFENMNQKRVSTYYGDKNMRMFDTEKDADKYLPRYEKARQLLEESRDLYAAKQGGQGAAKRAELDNHLQSTLPHTVDEFRDMFKQTTKDPEAGIFDLHTPFYKRYINQSVEQSAQLSRMKNSAGELKYPNFRREQDSVFNLYKGLDTAMGMEKSEPILTINDIGSVSNPSYKMVHQRTIDPFVAMDQAGSYLVRGRYLNDIKIKMAEQFVQEFGHLVDKIPQGDQLQDPINTLINGSLRSDGTATYAAAKDYQVVAKEFFNIKNDMDKERSAFKRKMLEGIFNKYGKEWGVAAEPWLMHKIPSAPAFMRSAAFHLKMLSPHQLFMQISTAAHAAAILGPKEAMIGTMLSSYYRAAMFTRDPGVIDGIASKVESMWGMPKAQWIESLTGLQRSGMMYVGREVGAMTDHFDVGQAIGNPVSNVAAAGRWFFNEGERIARLTAWAMGYREWRAANPALSFDNAAIKNVRYRADMLTGNMSSQSNASWQKGWAGVPTQFWGYNVRVTEQFLGKRLTSAEKSRMFWTYGALYGYPQMGNLFMPMWPMADWTRNQFLKNNVNPDQITGGTSPVIDTVGDVAFNGILGYLAELGAGETTNFNSRYGLGNSSISDLFDGSKSTFDAMIGAGGGVMGEILTEMEPFGKSLISTFNPHGSDYPITWNDFNNALTVQQGYSDFRKWFESYNTGTYILKSGKPVDSKAGSYKPSEAALKVLFGIQPRHVTDLFMMNADDKQIKESQRQASIDIINRFHASLQPNISDEERLAYRGQAHQLCVANAFTTEQCGELMKNAIAGRESIVNDLWKDMRTAPKDRVDAFKKILREGQP